MATSPNSWLTSKQISTGDIGGSNKKGGRAPWYRKSRSSRSTVLIGVAGGTASGKTSVCRAIVNNLQLPWVQILSLDCFYRPLTPSERANVHDYNFDHPDAFDWDLLNNVLRELKQGKAVKCPQYDFTTHSRRNEYTLMYGADIVLCEGILMLYSADICKQFDIKVFVNTDDDIRLIRRIKRDMKERGRSLQSVLDQYIKTVKPSYSLFCQPTQSAADIVIPRGKSNYVAIKLLCNHIKSKLFERGNINPTFYQKTSGPGSSNAVVPNNILIISYKNELILNDKLKGIQLLNTVSTMCNDLLLKCIQIFLPKRFKTPILSPKSNDTDNTDNGFNKVKSFELSANSNKKPLNSKLDRKTKSCDHIPSSSDPDPDPDDDEEIIFFDDVDDDDADNSGNMDKDDTKSDGIDNGNDNSDAMDKDDTKSNGTANGGDDIANGDDGDDVDDNLSGICVVTVFSGGMLFGETVMKMLGNNLDFEIKYGSIHIFHELHKPSKPRFYDRKLPLNINLQKVVIVDAFIGSGNRARMALQVLMDHNVPEENICFITLMASNIGIINLAKVFPNVQFITGQMSTKMGTDQSEKELAKLILEYCKAAGVDIIDDTKNNSK